MSQLLQLVGNVEGVSYETVLVLAGAPRSVLWISWRFLWMTGGKTRYLCFEGALQKPKTGQALMSQTC